MSYDTRLKLQGYPHSPRPHTLALNFLTTQPDLFSLSYRLWQEHSIIILVSRLLKMLSVYVAVDHPQIGHASLFECGFSQPCEGQV